MASCTRPLLLSRRDKGTGASFSDLNGVRVRCGRCLGCRMTHAEHWATRIAHEAKLHDENCFITLTYDEAHLPDPPSLAKREFQLFMKRLRRELEPKQVRFFGCGEYGEANKRPHYHLILFGHEFLSDRYMWRKTRTGHITYRSPILEGLWPHGLSEFGQVTHQSGGYVARYALKKALRAAELVRLNAQTGEFYEVEPEFILMSRRPGIGAGWWDLFRSDCFPSDFVVIDGKKKAVPPYYFRKLAADDPLLALRVSAERAAQGRARSWDDTTPRRLVKDELAHLRAQQLKRDVE